MRIKKIMTTSVGGTVFIEDRGNIKLVKFSSPKTAEEVFNEIASSVNTVEIPILETEPEITFEKKVRRRNVRKS